MKDYNKSKNDEKEQERLNENDEQEVRDLDLEI